MFLNISPIRKCGFANARFLLTFLMAVGLVFMAACGSTKVYTADKTMVYKGDIYNMSNVQRIGTRVEANLPNGDAKNMKGMDKKAVESLIKENKPLMVSQIVEMDSQEMVYQRRNVSKYSEYSSMMKSFDRAANDISKFMANKKTTQLKLK
jgi:hypothetical protein